jgi:hypothetical protein
MFHFDGVGDISFPSTLFGVGSTPPATFTLDIDGHLRSGVVPAAAWPEAEKMRAFTVSVCAPRA